MLLLSVAKWHYLLKGQWLLYDGDRQALRDLLNLPPQEQIWIQTDGRHTICQYWDSYVKMPMRQQAEDLLDPNDTSRGICMYV